MYLIELNSWLLPSDRCATYNAIVMRSKPPCNIEGEQRAACVSPVWKPGWRRKKLEGVAADSHCMNSVPGSDFSILHSSVCTYDMNMRGLEEGVL